MKADKIYLNRTREWVDERRCYFLKRACSISKKEANLSESIDKRKYEIPTRDTNTKI